MVDENNVDYEVDNSLLGEKLIFLSSKREAKNRFLKAAMSEKLCFFDKDNQQISGIPTQRLINLYSKWAHGGFGMILTGNLMIDIKHPECAGNTIIEKVLDSKERRDAFKKLADTMKSGGALAIAQLSHAGRMTSITINEHPFSASDVQFKGKKNGQGFGVPIPLTEEQIRTEVIARFVYTAKFCQGAGFDGVEIHGAHGYLLSQFMSPTTNKRTDQYGGSVYNRARLILEIYEAIRAEIPAETGFVVGIKMNSVEFQDQGLENEDALIMCKEFEKVGFDFIELSGGTIEKRAFHHEKESTRKREAYFIEFANKIKPALTKTIVYLTGGFRSVSGMISAIKDNVTDGIGMARPSAAEPDLPNKILTKNIQKAVLNPFENDHHLSLMAAQSQLWQGGEISYEETKNDLCFGIMNLSDPTVAETYTNDLLKFETDLVELAATGSPIIDVFEYKIKAGA